MEKTYVALGYYFEFETSEDADRGATRLEAEGIPTDITQGRFDGNPSESSWWVSFEDARWVSRDDVFQPSLEAEAHVRARAIERRLAAVGCVQTSWSVELSGGPARAE